MNGHHIHTPLAEGVGANLLERKKKKIQSLRGLPHSHSAHKGHANNAYAQQRHTVCLKIVHKEGFFTYFEVMELYKNGFYF